MELLRHVAAMRTVWIVYSRAVPKAVSWLSGRVLSTMHIGLDLTSCLPQPTGVDVAIVELSRALAEMDDTNQYTIFLNYEDHRDRLPSLPSNFRSMAASLRPRTVRLAYQQVLLPMLVKMLGIDVLHSPSFFMPLYRGRARHVLTVHDMTPFSNSKWHIPLRSSRLYRSAMLKCIERADVVTVPSCHTRQSMAEHFPGLDIDKIHVIPWGVRSQFRPYSRRDVERALAPIALPDRYILFVGTIEPRKNLVGLLKAYRRLIDRYDVEEQLVIAGTAGWGMEEFRCALREQRLETRVRYLGYIPDNLLPHLYAGAMLFVYPSLEEGFGFPPLEALTCGTPTIASACSAMAENLGDAAALVLPEDIEGLAATMHELLINDALRDSYRRRGLKHASSFSWQRTALLTLQSYQAAAAC